MNKEHPHIDQFTTDSRTLLPDRDSFYHYIQPALKEASAKSSAVVLLDIDVEGLDFVLRTFGPEKRDTLIREVGHRIGEVVGKVGKVFHITQDRFAVVLRGSTYRQATQKANALVNAFNDPFDVVGVSYSVVGNVGISQYPNHGEAIPELVRTSVFACHQAKKQENSYAVFDRAVDEWERHRFRLMSDLEQGLERSGEVRLAYQPLVDLETGKCVGAEGLCRWHHPKLGTIPPGDFLPYVEQTSLIMPLTETTLSDGLADLAHLRSQGFEGPLSINLSPNIFRQANALDRLLEPFSYAGMPPNNVHFEVTETGVMAQPNKAINMLTVLRDQGSQIAVDDFGTGHSSLAYLADLPIDVVKIDRHFIQKLSDRTGQAVVAATAMLAEKLGFTMVAEGIEEQWQVEKCRELGIKSGQGFHIARPMFIDDFQSWIRQSQPKLVAVKK